MFLGSYHYQIRVLIVPLWNWNTVENLLVSELRSFNRTFMELKYVEYLPYDEDSMF